MGLSEWFRDNGEIAKVNVEMARWRLSNQGRLVSRRSYGRGYSAGHSDAQRGRPARFATESSPHHAQTEVYGVEVDEGMSDLLVALWELGLETQFSCQGHPDRYLPNHAESWNSSAQIFFSDADQALKFIKKSIELLESDGYHEGGFRMAVTHGIDSAVLRGDVRFSPEPLQELTAVWTSFETTLARDEPQPDTL